MLSVDEVRAIAARHFERNLAPWMAAVFFDEARDGALYADSTPPAVKPRSISLKPPTEQQALTALPQVRAWVEAWRASELASLVEWEQRRWPSIGIQTIPCRLILSGPADTARCYSTLPIWHTAQHRATELARTWRAMPCKHALHKATEMVQHLAKRLVALDDVTWRTLLEVLTWLALNPTETPYVRQLPIRGIHTKWMEAHAQLVKKLASALLDRQPRFATPPRLIRIRALDSALSLEGLTDCALSLKDLAAYPRRPALVIVCENLVNTLALPPLEGTLAIHGGGYAAGEVAQVDWLAHTPVLYWGDLDTNGFAILNEVRAGLPHTASVLMDEETLQCHLDLGVAELSPNTGSFTHLHASEQATLSLLINEGAARGWPALRLEQERIEWSWACTRLTQAHAALTSYDSGVTRISCAFAP